MSRLADFESHHIEGFAHQGNTQFKVSLFSHIKDNLWTGGCPVDAAPEEFQFIVSLYPWGQYARHPHQVYLEAQLYDSGNIPDEKLLLALARHINECLKLGPTLVHCQAGLNRSALLAATALIEQGMTAKDAIALLREKRCDAVLCNRAFENHLLGRPAAKLLWDAPA